ncbi:hypothetical protein JHL18_10530 [Clostridium sp. YIM B02505]|uniref:N-acetyltransferase domain-containing protein n=1 Tax=Clostridium yunnanense TaxID=2800325 RepID=A0ABS1EP62_9CLOT|nr:hypothetical protein [Clostridium yunnanense]MBK1811063.1 hypothetical protein [Clostridium yunnanense]
MEYKIEEMKPSDWDQVREIYLEGIRTGLATFQTEAPNWEEWNKGHLESCRLVVRLEDEVMGWVALSPSSISCGITYTRRRSWRSVYSNHGLCIYGASLQNGIILG